MNMNTNMNKQKKKYNILKCIGSVLSHRRFSRNVWTKNHGILRNFVDFRDRKFSIFLLNLRDFLQHKKYMEVYQTGRLMLLMLSI
jgi:hypothetical protein